ncbi:hypothetical protein AALO_G00097710 [Alosa alosa]|uniref:C1q domain-containing protein n=1 Tax=Alosa alosa TaxID=278164 RepID=A0AAV6GTP7_9TELE|nr:complement C1q-like protein 2 [Alosa alosa]KAG5278325.1 hypothetical protein AALO_G00097710 [Alosa alosa]
MKTLRVMLHLLLSLWCGLVVVSGESGSTQVEVGATSADSTCTTDVHATLREMSALMGEQRVELWLAKAQIEALQSRLEASESTVDQMKKENQDRKVAFSLSLETTTDNHSGPFTSGTTLIFKQVISNVGNAYNSNTGFFTAPVRGVYDFSFSALSRGSSVTMAAVLRKNKKAVVSIYSTFSSHHNNASNGASLLLEVGDVVDVYLPANCRVLDNVNHHTTFRGHLLFEVEASPTTTSQ